MSKRFPSLPTRRPNSGAPDGKFTAVQYGMPDSGPVVAHPPHIVPMRVAGSTRKLDRRATFQLAP